jgi:low affinity Fe/Cu permease
MSGRTKAKKNEGSSARRLFDRFAMAASGWTGSAWAFSVAFIVILVWGISGPLFKFSNTWQLVINTGTTIVTFLMVFLIQHTQNKEAEATQLKLDALIRAVPKAENALQEIEELPDDKLDELRRRMHEGNGSRRARSKR